MPGPDASHPPAPAATSGLSDRVFTAPNVVSMLRVALVPVFALSIIRDQLVLAFTLLVVAGLTDWLDGYLARRLNQMSKLGWFLDHLGDRLYIAAALLGLAWRETVPWWLVAVLVLRELVVAAVLPPLAARGYGPLPVHLVGKGGTAMLMYAFPLLLLSEVPGPVGWVAWAGGWAAALWGVGLYWFAGVLYLRQARAIIRAEPRLAA